MIFLIIGAVLFVIGAVTGWLAANSPVQLHPIPLLGVGLGSVLMIFGLGGVVL